MSSRPAFYSLIQFCPDRFRSEAVNVGVVLFCPEPHFVRAKVAHSNTRAKRLFQPGTEDLARLESSKRAIEYRINSCAQDFRTTDDLERFVNTRANDIRLTEPRLVKVTYPESDLERLFKDLVEPTAATPSARPKPQDQLPPEAEQVFQRLLTAGVVRRPEPVTIPILGRRMEVPYAYQNGVLNLVKPHAFADPKNALRQAFELAAEGRLINRHAEAGLRRQLIVVSAVNPAQDGEDLEDTAQSFFDDYEVRLVRHAQAAHFAHEVERQAHH